MAETEKPPAQCKKCHSANRGAFVCFSCRNIEWLNFSLSFLGIIALLTVGGWIFNDAPGNEDMVQLFVFMLGAVLLLGAYTLLHVTYAFITEVVKLSSTSK